MRLEPLTLEQCQRVRAWRNAERQFLRTPYFITDDMQDEFYIDVVSNRNSGHRYFALKESDVFVSMSGEDVIDAGEYFIGTGGLTGIEWENGTAEISLILDPARRGQGYGSRAVYELLFEAFQNMNLFTVYGEVYDCGNVAFWDKVVTRYNGFKTHLPGRKFWHGMLYGSMWFSISVDEFRRVL